jgi:exopolysaccharide biosynthesis polyprenyl glycosylphosphotransferase
MLDLVKSRSQAQVSPNREGIVLFPQDLFVRMLCLERRRSNRSGKHFVLMLLDAGGLLQTRKQHIQPKLLEVVSRSTRDTDFNGWYEQDSVIGVIFTEVAATDHKSVVQTLSAKVMSALYDEFSVDQINEIRLSFHVFPEDWDQEGPAGPVSSTLNFPPAGELRRHKTSMHLKRLVDIAGSLALLILLLPVFLAIAIAIKLTSKGPVLFRQVRLGQNGKKFTFLKFRSMHVNNDPSIHEQYVMRFIAGSHDTAQPAGNQQKVYKLTADPRITPVGKFLRKTSLDELPQFWNVLSGEMSLVGPRPPVTYEFQRYHLWHRQRLTVKPGITGLWQVDGRSRVKFDDMVRLDIRYARTWSVWLDLKILFLTPRAVISGNGAC